MPLSVPGISSATPRKNWARVSGVDFQNQPLVIEGEGLFARMLQHETDHLFGTLFIDRLRGEEKKTAMQAIRQADYKNVSAAVQGNRAGAVSSAFGLGGK